VRIAKKTSARMSRAGQHDAKRNSVPESARRMTTHVTSACERLLRRSARLLRSSLCTALFTYAVDNALDRAHKGLAIEA
jgi:hypothetical protein